MTENYSVTSGEKEFKIPHVNLAYDHGMVRCAVFCHATIFYLVFNSLSSNFNLGTF